MKISARNQFEGTVDHVTEGAVNAVVVIKVGTDKVTADISMEAVRDLGITAGATATAIIKASSVLVAAGSAPLTQLSARNQFVGTVANVHKGAVNGHVALKLANGNTLMASITNDAIDELGLAEGVPAVGIIKASDVMVGV